MKKQITTLFAICSIGLQAQTMDNIVFSYDAGGNQIQRQLVDISPGRTADSTYVKEIDQLTDSDLKEADIFSDIKYYPNPVKEELFVQWTNTEKVSVESICIYTMSGQQITSVSNLKGKDKEVFSFSSFTEGIYNLVLFYSNGQKKDLKIIKRL